MALSAPNPASSHPPRAFFGSALRLHGSDAFQYVYAGKMRRQLGPIAVWTRPNQLGHARLGLSISRAVGVAVRRNRLKRHLREAFRLTHGQWPGAYDVIVVGYSHAELPLQDYQALLEKAVVALHHAWLKRTPAP